MLDYDTEITRCIRALNLPITEANYTAVREKIEAIESLSAQLTKQLVADLDRIDVLSTELSNALGTQNYALVAADVLTYQQDGRAKGILLELVEKVRRVGVLLSLKPDLGLFGAMASAMGFNVSAGGNASLSRS